MTLQDIYFIAEIIAAIAVIASLIFVGFQLRQGTAATRAATSQASLGSWTTISLTLAENPDLLQALWEKQRIQLPEWNATDARNVRLNYYMTAGMKIVEGNYLQWLDNNLSDELWHGFHRALVEMFTSNQAWWDYWNAAADSFSEPFQQLIEDVQSEADIRYNQLKPQNQAPEA